MASEKITAIIDSVKEMSVLELKELIDTICDMAGPDAIYATDVGQHQMWAAQYIRHINPRSFITSGGFVLKLPWEG